MFYEGEIKTFSSKHKMKVYYHSLEEFLQAILQDEENSSQKGLRSKADSKENNKHMGILDNQFSKQQQ